MAAKLKTLSYFLTNGRAGEVFYSDKKDKDITAFTAYLKVRIRTKKLLLIEDMTVRQITKITII